MMKQISLVAIMMEGLLWSCAGVPLSVPLLELPSASPDSFTWRMKDGAYRFGMQGRDQWRVESRDSDGSVYVRFAYKTPDGQVVENSYRQGSTSKRVTQRGESKEDTKIDVLVPDAKLSTSEDLPQHDSNIPQHGSNVPQHGSNVPLHDSNVPQQFVSSSVKQESFKSELAERGRPQRVVGIDNHDVGNVGSDNYAIVNVGTPARGTRVAKPYGAMRDAQKNVDFVDTNSIVDDQTRSIVKILS